MSERAKTRLEVLALGASIVSFVVSPLLAYATTQAVQSQRVATLEAQLDRMANQLEYLAVIDRRLAYIEGKIGDSRE